MTKQEKIDTTAFVFIIVVVLLFAGFMVGQQSAPAKGVGTMEHNSTSTTQCVAVTYKIQHCTD